MYIHIGLGKAGSSTLQRMAADNREALQAAGVLYLRLGGSTRSHARVAHALSADPPRRDGGFDHLARLVRDRPEQRILLSSEFFGALPRAAVEQLRKVLGSRPARIIQYVRLPYPEWVVSRYAQGTKKGRNRLDFDAYCAQREGISAVPPVLRWGAAFGPSSLRVRTLDAPDLVGGSLVRDFLDAIEVEMAVSAKRVNVAPSWYALEAARWCMVRLAPAGEAERMALASTVIRELEAAGARAGAVARAQYLTPEQSTTLARRFDADTAAIGARVGRRFPPAQPVTAARPFLPTASCIPSEVLAVLRGRLDDPPDHPEDGLARDALRALLAADQ